jgi:hypothetical protein
VRIAGFGVLPGKEVLLKARWSLYRPETDEMLLFRSSAFRKPLNEADDYVGYAAAWSEALANFSRDVAEAIRACTHHPSE